MLASALAELKFVNSWELFFTLYQLADKKVSGMIFIPHLREFLVKITVTITFFFIFIMSSVHRCFLAEFLASWCNE
ncbi:MAG: hypothetical protein A3D31_18060 [Candidatus Fluviicola riflensis]|nr:MAG: hypothetical protein CHH17_03000 [Candidatus Fluviicola riflensis]OGS76886.1 MAG: hypothetical protein A3D31_18060 [Candidatus Fluviicola riflensis]OGS81816.1 MAG: hypothetical protein A2724_15460 [Fluviicola sp. RIFCSPHIGHO2_01_FULL_43_53]OGS88615.1 MAG: hypothetical protein A3E30_07570 [Fluviicola sp. RIFCSPHIGHO2_12_FULL_43_24]